MVVHGFLSGCLDVLGLQADAEACKKLGFLKPVRADAYKKNIRAIQKKGPDRFVVGKRN